MHFNRFDVSTKELVWDDPIAWLRRFGIDPVGPVEVIDSDITVLTAAADKVIRVGGVSPFLVNIEFQSSPESELERLIWFRQVGLDHRHDLPVLTLLVLLHEKADSPSFTGLYERFLPDGRPTNRYHYQVVRLWEEPVESFLNAEVELLPLAPLSDVPRRKLRGVVRRMQKRINALEKGRASKLWTAAGILMGLRYSKDLVTRLTEGVIDMKESTLYQKILRDGRGEEARRFLILLGTERFGPPEPSAIDAIENIDDINRIERLGVRILDTGLRGWDDFLEMP